MQSLPFSFIYQEAFKNKQNDKMEKELGGVSGRMNHIPSLALSGELFFSAFVLALMFLYRLCVRKLLQC